MTKRSTRTEDKGNWRVTNVMHHVLWWLQIVAHKLWRQIAGWVGLRRFGGSKLIPQNRNIVGAQMSHSDLMLAQTTRTLNFQ